MVAVRPSWWFDGPTNTLGASPTAGRRDGESGSAPEPVRVGSHDPADRGIDHSRLDHHQLASDDHHPRRHHPLHRPTSRALPDSTREGRAAPEASSSAATAPAGSTTWTRLPARPVTTRRHLTPPSTSPSTISPPGDPGRYTASGAITDESDPANDRTFAGPVGATVKTVGVSSGPPHGQLLGSSGSPVPGVRGVYGPWMLLGFPGCRSHRVIEWPVIE